MKEEFPCREPWGSDTVRFFTSMGGRMKGSVSGRLSNTDSLTPKFLARMDLGVWTSQSSIWNVVLFRGVFWLVNECYIGV